MQPLAQTFLVDSVTYPTGVYVRSIDLFFLHKDTSSLSLPVTVKIGPISSSTSHPDFNVYYPYAVSVLYPSNVIDDPTGGYPTRFVFETPIYLYPGVHYFSVETNSEEYVVMTAVQGQAEFGTSFPISLPPFTGLLYLPSSSYNPVASTNEDLKFVINRCSFANTSGTVVLNNDYPTSGYTDNTAADQNVLSSTFTTFNIGSDNVDDFDATTIAYSYKKTNNTSNTLDASYSTFVPSTNYEIEKSRLNKNTFKISVDLSSSNDTITPLFDLDRTNGVFLENFINNDTTGETGKVGGSANAKYVTKIIELLPNVDADDLIAFAALKLPTNTDVKIYYKAAQAGVNIVTDVNYTEMTKTALGTPSTDSYVEYKFTTPTGFALPDQSFFSKFMFKIVMLSSDIAGKVPTVKDFRAIALLDS